MPTHTGSHPNLLITVIAGLFLYHRTDKNGRDCHVTVKVTVSVSVRVGVRFRIRVSVMVLGFITRLAADRTIRHVCKPCNFLSVFSALVGHVM